MKKRALLYIILTPILFLYGLAENHFNFSQTMRAYTLEFIYKYSNAWRVLFGMEYKDYSIKVGVYDFKLKSKKAKFDVDIALLIKELYGSHWTRFSKKNRSINYSWSGEYGSKYISIHQRGKDKFKIEYYNDTGWRIKRSLDTKYIFTKEEVFDTIKMIKNIN